MFQHLFLFNCYIDTFAIIICIMEEFVTDCPINSYSLPGGRLPASLMTCSTGALSLGQLTGNEKDNVHPSFPGKKLNPAIEFTSFDNNTPLKIVPDNIPVSYTHLRAHETDSYLVC